MWHVALVYAGLLGVLPGDSSPSPQDIKTYEALKLKAGADAAAQIKLALWCEAHGLEAERLTHLSRAVQSDPEDATARGLLGLILHDGGWESPDRIGERLEADSHRGAKLAEYNGRRAALVEKERDLPPPSSGSRRVATHSGPTRPGSRGTASSGWRTPMSRSGAKRTA